MDMSPPTLADFSLADLPETVGTAVSAGAEAPDAGRRTLALRLAQRGRLRELRAERLARLRTGQAPSAPPSPPQTRTPAPALTSASTSASAPAATPLTPRKAAEEDAVAALEEFLRALTGGLDGPATPPAAAATTTPVTAQAAAAAAVLPFQRPDPQLAPESARATPEAPAMAPDAASAAAPAALAPAAPVTAPPAPAPAPVPVSAPVTGLEQLPGAGPGLVWALRRAGITSLGDLAALEPEALAGRLGPIGPLIPAARWIEAARAAADPAA